jgi:hypothetical protein
MVATNNENITSTAVEQEITLTGPWDDNDGTTLVRIEMVSGTVQFTVGKTAIKSENRAYSVAGDKAYFTVQTDGNFNLRCKGVGVFTISW